MMRMPAVIIRHHRDRDITNLRFARELCFLQVGHADYVRAPTAIHIRLRLGGKLRTLHADVSAAQLGGYARSLACTPNDFRHFAAYRVAKSNLRHNPAPEKSAPPVPRPVQNPG